jgi:hypothetical protein
VNDNTSQVDDLRLVATPSAVNVAEMFVRFSLLEWSLRPLVDQATQVTRHMVAAVVDNAAPGHAGFMTVRMRLCGDGLVIEVEDERVATRPRVAPEVARTRIGVVPTAYGTRLWSELPLPLGMNASSVPLPRREQRRSPAAEALADEPVGVDPQVMRRILSALGGLRHPGV